MMNVLGQVKEVVGCAAILFRTGNFAQDFAQDFTHVHYY